MKHKTIPLDQLRMKAAEFDGIMSAAFEVNPKKDQKKPIRGKHSKRKVR